MPVNYFNIFRQRLGAFEFGARGLVFDN
jgi:hypothetical protein